MLMCDRRIPKPVIRSIDAVHVSLCACRRLSTNLIGAPAPEAAVGDVPHACLAPHGALAKERGGGGELTP